MKPATAGAPYTVPPEPSRLPSFLLAVAVHAILLAFLWFGISWQSNEPVAVEAEVWDMSVQSAAAPELPPPPTVEPEPQPEPPARVEPPPVERPVAPTPPDIALEREKERKAEQLKQEREEARKKELAEKKKREDAERKEKELAAKKEAEQKKKEAEKLAQEKKKQLEKIAKAEAARLEKLRQEDLKRMAGAMGSGGTAEKSSAPKIDSGYVAAITAKIKSNTTYAGNLDVPGNPKAVFKVDQLPTGEIMSVRLSKSSGVPEFDRAVENGIRKASPLPKKKDGTVERNLEVNFSMKDLD